MTNQDNPKVINFFQIKNINHMPYIELHGEYLIETNFMPNQYLCAEIYNGKIVITPVPKS